LLFFQKDVFIAVAYQLTNLPARKLLSMDINAFVTTSKTTVLQSRFGLL